VWLCICNNRLLAILNFMKADIFEIIMLELDYYIIERVRELRIKHEPYLSMLQLSHALDLPDSTVSKAENMKDRFKYNSRALNKIAIFFRLSSYSELFPQVVFQNDLVRIRLKKNPSKPSQLPINNDGSVDKAYTVLSVTPLTEKEIVLWHSKKIPYLTIIK
jgi:hypothetical protein